MRRFTLLALTSAALAGIAGAQTSVDVRAGPNGQLSGSVSAGGTSSSVSTGGNGAAGQDDRRAWPDQGAHSEARCTGSGRTMTVTSPDGSSSSSVSGSGSATVGGGGSPGSRMRYGGCDGPAGRTYEPSRDGSTYVAASSSAGTGMTQHRRPVRHHRKRRARR